MDSFASKNARKFGFNFVGCTTPAIFQNFTGHSRSDRCFQLLTRVLDGFLVFLILGVDEINPTQSSCVFKTNLFLRPLLLLLQLGDYLTFCPRLLAMNDLACMLTAVLSVSSEHKNPSGNYSSNRANRVIPVQKSDKSLDPSMFQ